LFYWFKNTALGASVVGATKCDDLEKLFQLLDSQDAQSKPLAFGLEVHHYPLSKIEVSFFGIDSSLALTGIEYPSFVRHWNPQNCLKTDVDGVFNKHYFVEFDYHAEGFRFMGLFQDLVDQQNSPSNLIAIVKYYLSLRQCEMGFDLSEQVAGKGEALLQGVCNLIGIPKSIGFVDRGRAAIKIGVDINKKNIEQVLKFVQTEFKYRLPKMNQCHSELSSFLRAAVLNDESVRLSLDIDLQKSEFMDLISIEHVSRLFNKSSCEADQVLASTRHNFYQCFEGYSQSEILRSKLTYAEKRPCSLVLEEEEIMVVYHNHSKLVFRNESSYIKDYCWVCLKQLSN